MTTWFNCLTIDIIGDLGFGEDFGSLDAGALQPRLQSLFTAIKQFTFVKEFLRLPSLLAMMIVTFLSTVMKLRGASVNNVGKDVMVERRAKSEVEIPDMVSYMLEQSGAKDGGYVCPSLTLKFLLTYQSMTHKEVDQAALTFVVAGSETSNPHHF